MIEIKLDSYNMISEKGWWEGKMIGHMYAFLSDERSDELCKR